ncbi:MAG: hypothetical protein RLZZ238_2461 [Planctomycetota bacterium]|jgi:hypothetical protein
MRDVRANSEVSDDPAPESVRVAVMLHEPAPGRAAPPAHLDLFVGPVDCVDPDARVARSWRLPLGAWTSEGPVAGRFAAVETPPHRAAYLSIAAPVELSDGRGSVTPLASGTGTARAAKGGAGAEPGGESEAEPRGKPEETPEGDQALTIDAFGHRIALVPRGGGNWTIAIAKEGPWILP